MLTVFNKFFQLEDTFSFDKSFNFGATKIKSYELNGL